MAFVELKSLERCFFFFFFEGSVSLSERSCSWPCGFSHSLPMPLLMIIKWSVPSLCPHDILFTNSTVSLCFIPGRGNVIFYWLSLLSSSTTEPMRRRQVTGGIPGGLRQVFSIQMSGEKKKKNKRNSSYIPAFGLVWLFSSAHTTVHTLTGFILLYTMCLF